AKPHPELPGVGVPETDGRLRDDLPAELDVESGRCRRNPQDSREEISLTPVIGDVLLQARVRVDRGPVRESGETKIRVHLDRCLGAARRIAVTVAPLAEEARLGAQVDRLGPWGRKD